MDYYSNYPEVCFTGKQDPTSSQVIAHLKSGFARHSIPTISVSDNSPQFSSEKFRQLLKDWEIQQETGNLKIGYVVINCCSYCYIPW